MDLNGYFIQRDDLIQIYSAWITDRRENPDDYRTLEDCDAQPVEQAAEESADHFIVLFERLFPLEVTAD